MKQTAEAFGGNFEHLEAASSVNIPMIETLWPFDTSIDFQTDQVYAGRTQGAERIGYEGFTCIAGKLRVHPACLKAPADYLFATGPNWFVLHVFAHQPSTHPHMMTGFSCGPWGGHFDRGNTWFKKSKPFMSYISRCQYMLRQGTPVADVLYYTGVRATGESGEYNPETPVG